MSWNSGAARLYGYAESEIIGRHASVLASPGEASPLDAVIPCLLRGETVKPVEVTRCRRDGVVLDLALAFSPIRRQ